MTIECFDREKDKHMQITFRHWAAAAAIALIPAFASATPVTLTYLSSTANGQASIIAAPSLRVAPSSRKTEASNDAATNGKLNFHHHSKNAARLNLTTRRNWRYAD